MTTKHDRMSLITVSDVEEKLKIWAARYRGKS
jgi:hypothetical protein